MHEIKLFTLQIQLWIHFIGNLLRIRFEFTEMNSVLQNHLIGNKASAINKNFFLVFLLKSRLLFSITCLLKVLKRKATVSEETIGFDVWMATILSYIKPCFTTRITIISYSIPQHFSWFTNYLKNFNCRY